MAFPTAVNDQVTDSVTQANVETLCSAPAMAMGSLFQTSAHSLSLAFENAVTNQQQQNTINDASTTNCIALLLDGKKSK
ncbi:RebB family R body protein [Pseudotenacibaculum haliotis]|uniref:RebB family R body protein n=1 Tax=Pseudotenacibaculum haliotis TaxID=1862138 RepID=A0ABW5LVX7_9FLAO